MIRLLKLELLKAKPAKFFWVLFIIFAAILISIPFGVIGLGEKLVTFLPQDFKLDNINFFFDWQDIWQNITFSFQYVSYFFLNALVIIHVAREFSLKTARQNVIDGLSKSQFALSKIYFILFMALGLTILTTLLCLIFGAIFSPSMPIGMMFENVEFIFGYFIHLVQSMTFGMLLAVLIRRPGIAVVVSFGYYWFDLLASSIVTFPLKSPFLGSLFPVKSQFGIIDSPFLKFGLMKVNTDLNLNALAISIGWIALQCFVSHWLIKKRNL